MTKREALEKVLTAAECWRDELGQEIIPEAESDESAEGYQETYDAITEALAVLRTPAESWRTKTPEPTSEFEEKRRELAEFLYELYYGKSTWLEVLLAPTSDDRFDNYMADADDILRSNPHLLTLDTVEQMGIDH
jgi:hypothetical protein